MHWTVECPRLKVELLRKITHPSISTVRVGHTLTDQYIWIAVTLLTQLLANVKVCKTLAKCNCEVFFLGCKTIDFCLNTTCDSPLFSICLKCADVHPVWKIPVVANRRKRKCRGDGYQYIFHNFKCFSIMQFHQLSNQVQSFKK